MLDVGTLYNRKPAPVAWHGLIETWLASLRARGQRIATVETKRRHIAHFARSNPGLRPEELTIEYVLAWSATKDWMPENWWPLCMARGSVEATPT